MKNMGHETGDDLLARGPILLVSRNSGEQTAAARGSAAHEVHLAARDLLRLTGIDVLDLLPSEEELVDALVSTKDVVVHADGKGKRFRNEFVQLELSEGVHLVVSTGSGHKVTDDLDQPFLKEMKRRVLAIRPSAVALHRWDRMFRKGLQAAELLAVFEKLNCLVFDGEQGRLGNSPMEQLFAVWRSTAAAQDAETIARKTREGQVRGTDAAVVGGRARCAVPRTLPPGLARVRVRTSRGVTGEPQAFLSSPEFLPCDSEIASGPENRIDGRHVDEMRLVTWVLANLGRPGMTRTTVGAELRRRHFSHDGIRRIHGAAVSYADLPEEMAGERMTRAIVKNLDFYRSGRLDLRLGHDDFDDLVIEGVFPPEGRWATREDFARIDAYLGSTRGGGPAGQGLVGVAATVDGVQGFLRTATGTRAAEGAAYVIRRSGGGAAASSALPAIPHAALAASLVDAISAASDEAWLPLVAADLPRDSDIRRAQERTQQELDAANRRAASLKAQLTETLEDGTLLLTPLARRSVAEAYEELVLTTVEPLEAQLKDLDAESEAHGRAMLSEDRSVAQDFVLRLIDCLQDPYDTSMNDVIKRGVALHDVTAERVVVHEHPGIWIRWSGTFRIGGEPGIFEIPIKGAALTGAAAQLEEKAAHAIAMMSEGKPFSELPITLLAGVRAVVAEQVGLESRYFGLATCPDGRLTRIGITLLCDPARDVARAAAVLDESEELVAAVLRESVSGRPSWSRPQAIVG